MHEGYKLVFLSIISAGILLLLLIIYRYVFPKKIISPFILLFLISLLPIVSIFRPGSYESGDLSLHTMRTISFYHLLFVEHIIPRWTPEFNVGYGDPYFLFSYFLPYLIGSLFHFLGFSFLISIKLLLALSFIFSGLTMYLWIKDELGEKAGFVSALFYLFAPYHLVDIHFRVSIAETLSFVFLPLILLFTKKIIATPKIIYLILGAISYAFLILTHQIIALSFLPISILYGLIEWNNKKRKNYKELISYILMIGLGLLLSLFYWLPVILEAKYTQASLIKNLSIFTTLPELIYSPWRFGFLFQGHHGELSYIIGYTQSLIVTMAIYLLFKYQLDKKVKSLLIYFLFLFCLFISLMLPVAKPIWQTVPLLQYFQFSYRLLELVALCTSVLAGIVVTKWNNKIFIILICSITVLYTILNWGNRKTIPTKNDSYLIQEFQQKPDVGMYLEPSSPIWTNLKKAHLRTKPKSHIEIVSGNAKIKELLHSSTQHIYIVDANTNVKIKENTLYFLGWNLLIDGKPHVIFYTNPKYPGIITFTLTKGFHEVKIIYKDTNDRKYATLISITTALFTVILLYFQLIKKTKKSQIFSFLNNNTNVPGIKRKRNIRKIR